MEVQDSIPGQDMSASGALVEDGDDLGQVSPEGDYFADMLITPVALLMGLGVWGMELVPTTGKKA